MALIKSVKQSLFKRWDRKSSLLLGLSGGPDSIALLYALLDLKIKPIIAHIDHGWRQESASEADYLSKLAHDLNLAFFTTTLTPPIKNLEDQSRKDRFLFFQKVYRENQCQALLLAHHNDDVVETSLQRLFEGAHLPFLGGIREEQHLWQMQVWRPLVGVCKAEILKFLEEKKLSYFQDPTNLDKRFLRGRVRLFVHQLETTFKKNFRNNLAIFAARSEELKSYLEKRTEEHHRRRKVVENTICWDVEGLEKIEARFLLQRSVGSIPRAVLDGVVDASFSQLKGKRFAAKGMEWTVFAKHITLKINDLR